MPVNNKTFTTFLYGIVTLYFCAISSVNANVYTSNSEFEPISLFELTQDVNYLASDKLKGRSNFRPEIHLAADYIAQRFNTIGLHPIKNLKNKQFEPKQLEIKDYFQPFNLPKNGRTYPLNNIISSLPGKSKKNDVIIFSAHYDHIGIKNNTSPHYNTKHNLNNQLIYNGANDNAASVAALFQLANYFKWHYQGSNQRTLLFIAFAGEELGLLGSKHFAKNLSSLGIKPEHVSAMINLEMIGKDSAFGVGKAWLTGPKRSNLLHLMNNSIEQQGSEAVFYQDPYPKAQLFYRSDNISLAKLGIPAHTLSSCQIDTDKDYHQVSDNIASLNLSGTLQLINNIAKASHGLIMATVTPSRVELIKK